MSDLDLFSGVAEKAVRAVERQQAPAPAAVALPERANEAPPTIQYTLASGVAWKVEKFADLVTEFELALEAGLRWPDVMALFHGTVAVRYPRGWTLVCRRFGVMPIVLPLDGASDDFRVWGHNELLDHFRLTRSQLAQEFDECRRLWQKRKEAVTNEAEVATRDEGRGASDEEQAASDEETDEVMLGRLHFHRAMFELSGRTPEENASEQTRFAERVREVRDFLGDRMTRDLTRRMLLNELSSWRLEVEMCKCTPGGKQWQLLSEQRDKADKEYRGILSDLDEIFPWKRNVGGSHGFKAVLSDLVKAMQEYRSKGSTPLIDRISTAGEVRVLFRQSVQRPVPQYRLGQILHIRDAIERMWDPEYRPAYSHAMLAKWDRLGARAIEEARMGMGEELPDITKDGESGEYPDNRLPETGKSVV